jgi:gluconolactonase
VSTRRSARFAIVSAAVVAAWFVELPSTGHAQRIEPLPREGLPPLTVTPPSPPRVPQAPVLRLDPALDAIVPPGATIERVATGFGFVEGPVWSRDGALLFSDIPGNTIFTLVPGKAAAALRTPSGYTGSEPRAPGSHIGSNGLTIDRQGRLIIAEHGDRRVSRLETDGRVTILADRYDGKRLNSPNDVVVKSDGGIYFTDPPYGLPKQDDDPAKELPHSGIYRIKDGKVLLLSAALNRPNGMAFSPDERTLYVANSENTRKIWMRFDVKADGTLSEGRVFLDVTADAAPGIPDGLRVDKAGNLVGTGPGGVWIVSPQGKPLGRIQPPELPANVAWGEDGKTLFMTARKSVYRIRLLTSGPRPGID